MEEAKSEKQFDFSDCEIKGHKYLGVLDFDIDENDHTTQWYWQEIGGLERVVFLSINVDKSKNELDCMIGCNRGFFDSLVNDFTCKLDNIDNDAFDEWLNKNLFSIEPNSFLGISCTINLINDHFTNVWERLNLGEYKIPGIVLK
jgi:hypothetical protein